MRFCTPDVERLERGYHIPVLCLESSNMEDTRWCGLVILRHDLAVTSKADITKGEQALILWPTTSCSIHHMKAECPDAVVQLDLKGEQQH